MSRPEKEIDWKAVENLAIAGSLGTEIAAQFDMHPQTFYRRVEEKYNVSFTAYCQEKRCQGNSILRAQQYYKAIGKTKEGDTSLLIWLGKQNLGQKDNHDIPAPVPNDDKIKEAIENMTLKATIENMKVDMDKLKEKINAYEPETR